MEFDRRTRHFKEIDLIPLINVVFLLLIFFLVAGTVSQIDAIPVDTPSAQTGMPPATKTLTILMGKNGEIVMNENFISTSTLIAILPSMLKKSPEMLITLKADAGLPAKKLTNLIRLIRESGGKNLSIATEAL